MGAWVEFHILLVSMKSSTELSSLQRCDKYYPHEQWQLDDQQATSIPHGVFVIRDIRPRYLAL